MTLRSELLAALCLARNARLPLARGTDRRGHIPFMTSIAERPADAATRMVPTHWEGDLINAHAMAQPSARWWSGRRARLYWHGLRGRMRGVPASDSWNLKKPVYRLMKN